MTNPLKTIPWWALAVAALCLADLVWRTWTWQHPRRICTTGTSINDRPILVMGNHHDNRDAVSIGRDGVWETVWAQWDFDFDRRPDTVSYFFAGRPVMNFHFKEGQPPQCEVYFYDADGRYTRWLDRGGTGAFTERIFYTGDGKPARREVLDGQTWHPASPVVRVEEQPRSDTPSPAAINQ